MTRPELRAALGTLYGPRGFTIRADGVVLASLPSRVVLGRIDDPRLEADVSAMVAKLASPTPAHRRPAA
jgi:hypothetical protein